MVTVVKVAVIVAGIVATVAKVAVIVAIVWR
jgi:hypothetical protein